MNEMRQLKYRFNALFALYICSTLLIVLCIINQKPVAGVSTTVYRTEAAIPGPMGPMGLQGLSGIGINGKDGQTVVNTITQLQPLYVQGSQGPVGPAGKDVKGDNGESVSIRKNPDTGDIETKNTDDLDWTVLLSKCEYNPGACTQNE